MFGDWCATTGEQAPPVRELLGGSFVAVPTCNANVWSVEDSGSLLAHCPLVLALVPSQVKGVTSTSLPFTPLHGLNSVTVVRIPSVILRKSWMTFRATDSVMLEDCGECSGRGMVADKDDGGACERKAPTDSADDGSDTALAKRLRTDIIGLDPCRGADFVSVEVAKEVRTLVATGCNVVVGEEGVVAEASEVVVVVVEVSRVGELSVILEKSAVGELSVEVVESAVGEASVVVVESAVGEASVEVVESAVGEASVVVAESVV